MDTDKIEHENIDIIFLQKNYICLKVINGINFTPREIDIISCIISGRSPKKIALLLSVAARTAENHKHNVMLKIGCGSKENVIDFIEKSGKLTLLKKHYAGLLIQAAFEDQLRKISSLIKEKPPNCTIICDKESKYILTLLLQLEKYLKLVGIKVTIDLTVNNILAYLDDKLEIKDYNHIFYSLPLLCMEQLSTVGSEATAPYFMQLAIKNNIYFLLFDIIPFNISKWFESYTYINLKEQENFYFFVFEILKKLLPNLYSLEQNTNEFKNKYITICDPSFLAKTIEENITSFYISGDSKLLAWCTIKTGWLIVVLLIIFSTIISLFTYSTMEKKQLKEINQLMSPEIKTPYLITSYLPEILTGHELFIGRENELRQIGHFLDEYNTVIITGRGGIGKSSCAIEYGKRSKQGKIIRYFNAESINKIDQQYKELAREFKIDVDKQQRNVIMQLINNKLSTITAKILLVFDNVDNYDDIKEYLINLPHNVQTIVTTRQPILVIAKPHIAIEEFSNMEAKLYLKNSLSNRAMSEELMHKLIENTGTLPYDVKCVAAYLIENPSITEEELIKKIGNDIKDKLFEEFTISLVPEKQFAWKILQYTTSLDPDFVDIEIIKALFPQEIEMYSLALRKLESLSIISIINNQLNQVGFRIHRNIQKNVQNSAKNHHKHAIKPQQLTGHLLNVLDRLFPEITFNPTSQWQTALSLQPHVEKLLNTKIKVINRKDKIHLASLYYKLARYYSAISMNYQLALKYARIALERRSELYNNKNSDLADSFHIVGVIYRKLGNVQESLRHLEKGLQIRQLLYSGIHPEIAASIHTIGSAYNQNGETAKGLKYAQMALEMNQKLYFGNHYDTGCDLNLVGISYLDLGDFQKSLEYFKSGLKMFYELNPAPYEKIAALQSNIAYNYNKLGNHEEAIKYAQASVDIFKKKHPNGHSRAIYSLDDLGDSLIRTNQVKKGLEVLHEALKLSQQFGMEKHYITAFVLQDLGWGYFKKKDYRTALQYAEKALILRRELYGSQNYHELAESLHNLGDIYLAVKNPKEALNLYQEALDMYIALSLEHLPQVSVIKQQIVNLIVNAK